MEATLVVCDLTAQIILHDQRDIGRAGGRAGAAPVTTFFADSNLTDFEIALEDGPALPFCLSALPPIEKCRGCTVVAHSWPSHILSSDE